MSKARQRGLKSKSAPKHKLTTQPEPVVREPLPPPPPLPTWFSSGPSTPDNRGRVQVYSHLAYQVVDAALAGHFGLPDFQRAPAWTREQQVLLLDSLMRGWPIGGLLVWRAPKGTPCRALQGCPEFVWDSWSSFLVLDGQQRLTALVAAARGELDARWDGERWGPTGYLDSSMCFRNPVGRSADRHSESEGWWDYQCSVREYAGKEMWEAALHAWENVHRAEVQLIVIEGDEEAARDAYRRFNGDGAGTAHTAADLARATKPGSPQTTAA